MTPHLLGKIFQKISHHKPWQPRESGTIIFRSQKNITVNLDAYTHEKYPSGMMWKSRQPHIKNKGTTGDLP